MHTFENLASDLRRGYIFPAWVIWSLWWPSPSPQTIRDLSAPFWAPFLGPKSLASHQVSGGCHVILNSTDQKRSTVPPLQCSLLQIALHAEEVLKAGRAQVRDLAFVGHLAATTRTVSWQADWSWNSPVPQFREMINSWQWGTPRNILFFSLPPPSGCHTC